MPTFGTGLFAENAREFIAQLRDALYTGCKLPSGESVVTYERSVEAGRVTHTFRLDSFQPNGSRTIVLPEPEV